MRMFLVLFTVLLSLSLMAIERVGIGSVVAKIGNNTSDFPSISGDGRYVAFSSSATNLITGDANSVIDVFVHDHDTNTTECVSVDSSGIAGDGNSQYPTISSDGRYVAFSSNATNLVAEDTNAQTDIFVHDRDTGTTQRVSIHSDGTEGDIASSYPSISSDGRYISFKSYATNLVIDDTNSEADIFVHDRNVGMTQRVSIHSDGTQANDLSESPSISSDGRYVAFSSVATNLVTGDTNGVSDVFVHDCNTGTTQRISIHSDGTEGDVTSSRPSISSDGRYISFQSYATNLVTGDTNDEGDIFVYDQDSNTTERVSVDSSGIAGNAASGYPSISSDGRYISFQSYATNLVTGDTNNIGDIFVHDRDSNTTERVSVDSSGTIEANGTNYSPSISSDGLYVSFHSAANNLVIGDTNSAMDVFTHDRQSTTTVLSSKATLVKEGDNSSFSASTSDNGRYIAFHSDATNLVAGDSNGLTDIFVHNHDNNTTTRVSIDSSGVQSDGSSSDPSISGDGRYVAFKSSATNLIIGDSNSATDIFVHDQGSNTTECISIDSSGNIGNGNSYNPSISGDGRYVAFYSDATDLILSDTNGVADIFVHDRQSGETERVSIHSNGTESDYGSYYPFISSDGRFVAFHSDATTLIDSDSNYARDIFVHDRTNNMTERVSIHSNGTAGNGNSQLPSLSSDGRYVAFHSDATNLVISDTNGMADIFVHDRQNNTTERVSIHSAGTEGDNDSYNASISSDGNHVTFHSNASNLTSGLYVGSRNIFVHDRQSKMTERVSVDGSGGVALGNSSEPAISGDGSFIVFESDAANLVPDDNNAKRDIFITDNTLFEPSGDFSPALIMYLLN